MRVIVAGMFSVNTSYFEIGHSTYGTWVDLRTEIRTKLAHHLPFEVFDKYYRCFQLYVIGWGMRNR